MFERFLCDFIYYQDHRIDITEVLATDLWEAYEWMGEAVGVGGATNFPGSTVGVSADDDFDFPYGFSGWVGEFEDASVWSAHSFTPLGERALSM